MPAKSDVREIRTLRQVDPEQHVVARSERRPRRRHPDHAGDQRRHREPQGRQRRAEERVLLEAVAAAPRADELGLQRAEVQRNRPAEQRVQVVEGDGVGVQPMQGAKDIEGRFARAVEADAREVGVEIENHVFPPIELQLPTRARYTTDRAERDSGSGFQRGLERQCLSPSPTNIRLNTIPVWKSGRPTAGSISWPSAGRPWPPWPCSSSPSPGSVPAWRSLWRFTGRPSRPCSGSPPSTISV